MKEQQDLMQWIIKMYIKLRYDNAYARELTAELINDTILLKTDCCKHAAKKYFCFVTKTEKLNLNLCFSVIVRAAKHQVVMNPLQ